MPMLSFDTRISFMFLRRQFLLVVSFAITINKNQGQSLKHVGTCMSTSLFSRG